MAKMTKMDGSERKKQLLAAGAKLAAKYGASNVTRRMVAAECGCAEGLVSVYLGGTEEAQKAYARAAKRAGLPLPNKEEAAVLGAQLRAHGPRDKRDTRKRSAKEVDAIKRKTTGTAAAKPRARKLIAAKAEKAVKESVAKKIIAKSKKSAASRETKPKRAPRNKLPMPADPTRQPMPGTARLPVPPEVKTAARKPKAPPPAQPVN